MIDQVLTFLKNTNENISIDEIKRKFNLNNQELEILFPFLISSGIKINTFDSLNLKCSDCPINKFCDKKNCGG
ncbi:hypothetical protein X275_07190 [Marinitoga sp. 1197]|uniref:hypothetical protein n=1 Tax=Marinitoga sp. 1197 TaxID=1428449 RepID=UPI0006411030|nr:hypothetical protein [Marinitoga sp. 1197]KLO22113.1 hypothetical protein X275_07190 [Marinitoga sp. 1197]